MTKKVWNPQYTLRARGNDELWIFSNAFTSIFPSDTIRSNPTDVRTLSRKDLTMAAFRWLLTSKNMPPATVVVVFFFFFLPQQVPGRKSIIWPSSKLRNRKRVLVCVCVFSQPYSEEQRLTNKQTLAWRLSVDFWNLLHALCNLLRYMILARGFWPAGLCRCDETSECCLINYITRKMSSSAHPLVSFENSAAVMKRASVVLSATSRGRGLLSLLNSSAFPGAERVCAVKWRNILPSCSAGLNNNCCTWWTTGWTNWRVFHIHKR